MTVIDTYTIQIVRDDVSQGEIELLGRWLAEAEENLTDLLPPGFRARIQRWDEPDEPHPTAAKDKLGTYTEWKGLFR